MTLDSPRQFREQTSSERAILGRLLTAAFGGREEIREQILDARVRELDEERSLEFRLGTRVRAPVKKRIPVEGSALDEDGIPIHFLLHVVNGYATELEVFKADCSRIKKMPAVADIEVVSTP